LTNNIVNITAGGGGARSEASELSILGNSLWKDVNNDTPSMLEVNSSQLKL
jgi:hypothetical protein